MKPDICPLCAVKLTRHPKMDPPSYVHHPAHGCILSDFSFEDTPENVALWNRRVGKPLWAPDPAPEPERTT